MKRFRLSGTNLQKPLMVALLAIGMVRSWALVIDDFSQGAVSIRATNFSPGATVVQTGLDSASVLGGSRSVYAGSLNLASLVIDANKARLDFVSDISYGYFKLDWGATSPLDVNLALDANSAFALSFVDVTPGLNSGGFELRLKNDKGWVSYDFSRDFFNAASSHTFGLLAIPVAVFGITNLSQAQQIEIDATRVPQGVHLSFHSLEIIPEPATSFLCLAAFVALWIPPRLYPPSAQSRRAHRGQLGVRC